MKPSRLLRRALGVGLLVLAGTAAAQTVVPALRLAAVFGDHMVLQRDQPLRIWGWAAPGSRVQLTLAGHEAVAPVDAAGRWQASLAALPAGGPHALQLRSTQDATVLSVADVLIGDVWLCAGQSNMEWPLSRSAGGALEVAQASQPMIRHLKPPHRAALRPQADVGPAAWQTVVPGGAGEFSAAGYYFARRLQRDLGVPIGLVNLAWGGTHIETWTSPAAALRDPDLAVTVSALPADFAAWSARAQAQMQAIAERWQGQPLDGGDRAAWLQPGDVDRDWRTLDVPRVWEEQGLPGFDGRVWFRREVMLTAAQAADPATLELGAIDDCDETHVNGQRVGGRCQWDAARVYALPLGLLHEGRNLIAVRVTDTGGGGGFHGEASRVRLRTAAGDLALAGPWRARVESALLRTELQANDAPTLAFNGLVQPLLPLSLRGVIWYQGESNVPRAARYAAAFRNLITDWRAQWQQPDLTFLFVQLASFGPLARNTLQASAWAELREAQQQALALPHTGMVVATDIGDADSIHPPDKRSVGERLAGLALRDTHGQSVVAQGPVLREVRVRGATLRLRFDAGPGQTLALRAGSGSELQGFAIADASRHFLPAQARIEGAEVVVSRDGLKLPVAVRYGWVDNPQLANLVNGAGLPASPWRSDDWPLSTEGVRYTP
jgi:sialate O-acetylesterase